MKLKDFFEPTKGKINTFILGLIFAFLFFGWNCATEGYGCWIQPPHLTILKIFDPVPFLFPSDIKAVDWLIEAVWWLVFYVILSGIFHLKKIGSGS